MYKVVQTNSFMGEVESTAIVGVYRWEWYAKLVARRRTPGTLAALTTSYHVAPLKYQDSAVLRRKITMRLKTILARDYDAAGLQTLLEKLDKL